jgi:hypothetical protein
MPFLKKIEARSNKEIEGGFQLTSKDVNIWVRLYKTEIGLRIRLTTSFRNEEGKWINTPPIWIDKELANELSEAFSELSKKMEKIEI